MYQQYIHARRKSERCAPTFVWRRNKRGRGTFQQNDALRLALSLQTRFASVSDYIQSCFTETVARANRVERRCRSLCCLSRKKEREREEIQYTTNVRKICNVVKCSSIDFFFLFFLSIRCLKERVLWKFRWSE